jgi:hypothetical protein
VKIFPVWWAEDGVCACETDCTSPAKHPLTRNGVKDATDDPEQIEAWRDEFPDANWALRTGAVSDVVVVDLDVKPGKNGFVTLTALAKPHGGLPRTRVVKTGSGGLHVYFRHPGGHVPNSAGKIGLGVDVRGDDGYVLLPGSNHVSGGTYEVAIDAEIAELPEWLPDLVVAPPDVLPTATTERGHFPPASADDLESARDTLDAHGPAIQGEGGDAHTYVACAIVSHDYAFTDEEAMPLLLEWNESCVPPWREGDLRAKLRSGTKYGRAAYGCKRAMDALATARKLIKDWENGPKTEDAMWTMIDACRALNFDNPGKREMMERELHTATGLSAKALALPRARPPTPVLKSGEILVTVNLAEVADAATKSFAPQVFQRGGALCQVVQNDRTFIHDLERAGIVDLMSQTSNYVRPDPKEGKVSCVPPDSVAGILHARRQHAGVRIIEAVTTAPIFLADGSILEQEGYNAQARVYLKPSVSVNVPDQPTHDDAQNAVRLFKDLTSGFTFASPADFSSWLAGLLSPLVKAATGNAPAPLICISAASPGIGKTLLTKVIGQIVTGEDPAVRPYNSRDEGEWCKKITSFVRAASPVNVFDNCNGPIGDDALDSLLTSSTWSDRILGASEAPPLPIVSTWFATGNNIEPIRDTVRRVLLCRLDVLTERPQERTDFKYDLEGGHAKEHRSELLTAALTILRAYHVADRPRQTLPTWGSFPTWSRLVRGALVWTGLTDPYLTQQRASEELHEPENDAHDFWISVVADSDGTANGVVTLANSREAMSVLGLREGLTPVHLKKFIGRFVDKPRDGRRIRRGRDEQRNATVYRVEAIG